MKSRFTRSKERFNWKYPPSANGHGHPTSLASGNGHRPTTQTSDLRMIRRMLFYSGKYWPLVVFNFFFSMIATPLALMVPVPLKIAIDSVLGNARIPGFVDAVLPDFATRSDSALLLSAAIMLIALTAMIQIHSFINSIIGTYVGERLVLDFRSRLFRHVQRLSLAYHDTKGPADSTYRIQYDVLAIQKLTLGPLTAIVGSALTLIGMLYVTARLDAQIALLAVSILPLLMLTSQVFKKRLRARSRDVKQLETSGLSIVQEVLGAIRVVKAFGQEDREQERFVGASQAGMRARLRLEVSSSAFGFVMGLVTAAGTAAVLYLGVRHVQSGALRLGELTMVMAYLSQLYSPLKSISKKMASLQGSLAGAERMFEVLDTEPDVEDRPHARHIKRAAGHIQFNDVSFGYEKERPVLRGISFDVPTGTRVGIAGRTGAGKTTLVNLLMRFYDPQEGEIALDDMDIRDYKLADLRSQFALVLQEPVLFSSSIAENIAYARPGASFDEIAEAVKAADAHWFIEKLPDGYDTLVGDRGMRLSGGERQRVSLARAFLKDAPILVLDEPTSSVDVKTEAAIMEAMDRLMHGRTTFMIAHRLSTLEHCDTVLQIDGGRLVAAGPPGETGVQLVTDAVPTSLIELPEIAAATLVGTAAAPELSNLQPDER